MAYLQCRVSEGRFPLEKVDSDLIVYEEDVLSTRNLYKGIGIRQPHLEQYEDAVWSFEHSLKIAYKTKTPSGTSLPDGQSRDAS